MPDVGRIRTKRAGQKPRGSPGQPAQALPHVPLSALLSHALVAFTIEFDNEFEHLVPHRTTRFGGSGPWLVSMVMWLMLLRFVPEEGIGAKELYQRTALSQKEFKLWLTRLSKWWGYLAVDGMIARWTPGGVKARAAWSGLTGVIEGRWQARFGSAVDSLCDVMRGIANRDYPDYLPVLGFDLLTPAPERSAAVEDSLPGLLAKLLRAFAVEFERESGVSIAVCANVGGVSKEAMAMLRKRAKCSSEEYLRLTAAIEHEWNAGRLRELLEEIVGHADFWAGLTPYPDGWRAAMPAITVLPNYPMVLHRGGFPDGA
ncbi:MAG TPA: hypothetical protein VHC90_03750 [Bryobacteraceae bacterium]|nr:hypothetical protein [Bryobacteraceae bacterium]